MKSIENKFDYFTITTNKNIMDNGTIHDFLTNYSGWRDNIPIEKIQNAIDNSLNFRPFHKENQIGFARVISDYTIIAYLGVTCYRSRKLKKQENYV